MTATAALRTELCVLLGEAEPPTGRFTQVELDYYLGKGVDVYEAASFCWKAKAVKLIEAGGLVQAITVGSESYRFASITDLEGFCDRQANAMLGKSTAGYGASGLIVAIADPAIEGLDLSSDDTDEM